MKGRNPPTLLQIIWKSPISFQQCSLASSLFKLQQQQQIFLSVGLWVFVSGWYNEVGCPKYLIYVRFQNFFCPVVYKSTVDIQSSLGAKLDDGVKWMFRVSFFLLLFWDNWLLMPGIYNTQRDLYLKVNADLQYQPSIFY